MLVLYYACERDIGFRIVDDRIALPIPDFEFLVLEPDCAICQLAEPIAVEFIQCAGVHQVSSQPLILFPVREEIAFQPCLNIVQKGLDDLIVASDGYSLICVIEVVVVECEPERQSFDYESRKISAFSSPLFLCVTFDQFLIDVGAYKNQSLFLKVLWLPAMKNRHSLSLLIIYFPFCFFRCCHTP